MARMERFGGVVETLAFVVLVEALLWLALYFGYKILTFVAYFPGFHCLGAQ